MIVGHFIYRKPWDKSKQVPISQVKKGDYVAVPNSVIWAKVLDVWSVSDGTIALNVGGRDEPINFPSMRPEERVKIRA